MTAKIEWRRRGSADKWELSYHSYPNNTPETLSRKYPEHEYRLVEQQPEKPTQGAHLPTNAKERKRIPLFTGLLKYFPDALVEVARVSYIGNEQHNPGQPLHWARGKSMDQEDTLMRHLLESGTTDVDGVRHSAKVAWRALAMLQLEIEKAKEADAPTDNLREINETEPALLR